MSALWRVAVPGLVAVVGVAAAHSLLVDARAGWSALGGGFAVAVLLTSTPVVLGPITRVVPELSLAAAVTFYLTKVAVLAVALSVLAAPGTREQVDLRAVGTSVIAVTLVWTALLVVAELRTRRPLYDLP
ncbi:hypothetical protein GCM10009821_24060 [Aeromicrobium halocynthiae]|uniref:Uncharacterized protein n=1 Tax=Aeromicrobium halocynthiae TaxID=560557 RepID=A0ABN2W2X8_9ACTN